ncbi:MAG TPA: type II toxin-antitoxin system Phd/YefM family antitoxin, partial [Syntrophales bacterium]|nr:type II toxin-antitoxin system Phd/YefM family antitoxin [Syntrophales bacterium]
MKMSEDIRPVTYLKSRTADLLAQVNETKRPVIITQNGEARGVLQDTESYESMKAAIAILKLVVQGEDDLRKGDMIPHDEVFRRIENRLKSTGTRRVHE